jgi:hypothetical protein
MIMNGALLLLLRSLSIALLAMVGGQWVLYYVTADMGLYFMYKLLRRDAWHWVPLEGAASVLQSFLLRFFVKILVDFTGVIQFRAAGEMGGAAFTLSMVRAREAAYHGFFCGGSGQAMGLEGARVTRARRRDPLNPPFGR